LLSNNLMKKLLLILAAASYCFAQTDAYGGLNSLASPTGSTGAWKVEKYTIGANQRWLMTTPAGHGYWCGALYALVIPLGIGNGSGNLNASGTAKYTTLLNWKTAALSRYIGWGFNCMAEYSDYGLQNDMVAGLLGSTKVPYWKETHMVGYALQRTNFGNGQVMPTDAVKDLRQLTPSSIPYSNYVSDGFDPNLDAYIDGYLTRALTAPVFTNDPFAASMNTPYTIGMWADDNDYIYGFGPGPDDCVTPNGVYHASIGWIGLSVPTTAYAQWNVPSNVYSANNWIFTNTDVHAKKNLIAFLKTRYSNSISALNTAWGSTYTAFDSAETRYTGETVGTTDGTASSLNYTLAHTTGISKATIVLKVSGNVIGTDRPQSAVGASGFLLGRWPDNATTINGTINYSTGAVVVTAQNSHAFTVDAAGGTTWTTPIDLGQQNIVSGSMIVRRYPANIDCRLADDRSVAGSLGVQDQTCSPSYTVSGTINYGTMGSNGTLSNLTITPALTVGQQIQISFTYNQAIPNSCGGPCTVTIDYSVNGYGVGTTVADENGSHTAWLGDYILAKPGNVAGLSPVASAGAWTDLNDWLYNFTASFTQKTAGMIKTHLPNQITTQAVGGHYGCPRKAMAQAIAANSDLIGLQVQPTLMNLLPSWGMGDVPIMDTWDGFGAQADSAGVNGTWNNLAQNNLATQNLRGAAMAVRINDDLTIRGTGNSVYQTVGKQFWAYNDTDGSTVTNQTNYGLVTPSDNTYDGHENVMGSVACSVPINAYTCGGETYTWAMSSTGDAITAIKAALATIPSIIAAGASSGGGTTSGTSKISGSVVRR